MSVWKRIRNIAYYLYEPRKSKKNKKAKQRKHEIISLPALFICLCLCLYACAISSPILLRSNRLWAHHACEKSRDFSVLRLQSDLEGLAVWSFGTLEVSKGAFGCYKYYLSFCFCLNGFDARACSLSVLSIEMLIWKV